LKYNLLYIFLISQFIYSQQFRNINEISGLGDVNRNNGVSVADFDQDGDLDIFIVSQLSLQNGGIKSRLFENKNDGTFDDITENTGINQGLDHYIDLINDNGAFNILEHGDRLSASWGDFNNDGYPDLFLGNAVQSELYKNIGDGSFVNITESSGLEVFCDTCYIAGALWLDYDLDGYLDLFLSDYNQSSPNKLYKNLGDETFELIDLSSFIESRNSFSAIPIYVNDDMYPDLYIANDFEQDNQLLINDFGNGFIDMTDIYGLQDPYDGMGLATCDYNNDMQIDILITNINENGFYESQSTTENSDYIDIAEMVNIKDTGWSWGAIFSDFNHDGFEDLYVANGFWFPEYNFYYVNKFIDGNSFTGESFSDDDISETPTMSRSVNSFDYDNDGDLDLIYSNFDSQIHFYENRSIDDYFTEDVMGNWIKFKLEGTTSNKDGLGVIIQANFEDGTNQIRHYTGSGYQHQSIQAVHFGGAENNLISYITVTWPNTGLETYYDLQMNSTYKIVEGEGIQLVDNNTAVKVEGCTNENSCNYNPNAFYDDGSCLFIDSQSIEGQNIVEPFKSYSYSYADESIISYEWDIKNGEIISGNGTSEITVKWDISIDGSVKLIASNEDCSTDTIILDVTMQLPDSTDDFNVSVARLWNEVLLYSIRNDLARPTVHARNLFHVSAAMYDAWSIINQKGSTYLLGNSLNQFNSEFISYSGESSENDLVNAISHSAYRMITHRFSESPGFQRIEKKCDILMTLLGLNVDNLDSSDYQNDSTSLGNYIAENYISYGMLDGSNENLDYNNLYYSPLNESMSVSESGNINMTDPNRWQPLSFETFVDQSGNVLETNTPEFLGAEWGNVWPFGLNENDLTEYQRDGNIYNVYHDPGSPPFIDENEITNDLFIEAFSMVSIWGSHLSPNDDTIWDISPNSLGNVDDATYPSDFSDYTSFYDYYNGGDTSQGYSVNPVTNDTYEIQNVLRGDYTRVLAEYWADGPDSETPPGHWFVLLNSISDNPQLEKKFQGQGDVLSDLEWDIKSYFILGGVMHDVAVSVWGIKGWYDYVRPISAIRYFSELGQSTIPIIDNYNENGFKLIDGLIEIVMPNDPLAIENEENIGKIKLYSWRGHDYIDNTENDFAGVGWILAENWWPYQRPTFVTPNFAGYVSGHSTYSRAAAEMLENFTGSPYFPGGLETHLAKQREFLVFEDGPSQDVELQWVSFKDAADQCSLSRIWGGIHPYIDDIPGRLIGQIIGNESFEFGAEYFENNLSIIEPTLPDLKILKNPIALNEDIHISNSVGNEDFKLYDISGKIVPISVENSSNISTIKTQGLNQGFYLLKSAQKVFKIIVK